MIIKKATKIVRKVSLGILSLSLAGAVFATPALAENWTLTGSNIWNNNSGNVGIGTGVPLTKFHFIADTVDQGFITAPRIQAEGVTEGGWRDMVNLNLFTNNAGAGYSSGLAFSMLNSESSPVEYARIRSVIVNDVVGSGALDLMVKQNGTLTTAVRVNNTGNVGIGTTSPTEKLTVVGNIRSNGSSGYFVTDPITSYPAWYEQWIPFSDAFAMAPMVILTLVDSGDIAIDSYRILGSSWPDGFYVQFHVLSAPGGATALFSWLAISNY